jgi:hypothetical protein
MSVPAAGGSSLNLTGPVTVEAWIKVASLGSDQQSIIERYGGSYTGSGGYLLRLNATGKVLFATAADAANVDVIVGGTTVTTGVWHHVAGVFDGSQLRVYLDGQLDNSKASSFAPTSGTSNLEVGISGGGAFAFPFNGLIDEARVSAGAVYSSNFTPPGCLTAGAQTKGLWKFDGQTTADFSGNGNTGSLQGGATYSTDVPVCGPSSPELAETLPRDLWIGLSSFYRLF